MMSGRIATFLYNRNRRKGEQEMKDLRKLAVYLIYIGVASLVVGAISRLLGWPVIGLQSRVFAGFTVICLLLSINLLLLDKKS